MTLDELQPANHSVLALNVIQKGILIAIKSHYLIALLEVLHLDNLIGLLCAVIDF